MDAAQILPSNNHINSYQDKNFHAASYDDSHRDKKDDRNEVYTSNQSKRKLLQAVNTTTNLTDGTVVNIPADSLGLGSTGVYSGAILQSTRHYYQRQTQQYRRQIVQAIVVVQIIAHQVQP